MHRALFLLAVAAAVLFSPPDTFADHARGTFRYPKVYGSTGRPYGPTQAHYQYQRRYGQPWHGYGGLTADVSHHGHFSSHHRIGHFSFLSPAVCAYPTFGYGLAGRGASFNVIVGPTTPYPTGYVYTAPSLYPVPVIPPAWYVDPLYQWPAAVPMGNGPLDPALGRNDGPWNGAQDGRPAARIAARAPRASSPEEKIRSVRLQAAGDMWFQQQNYLNAYGRYKDAISAAEDRAEAHFRLAFALTAMGRYQLAVKQLKRGLQIDPSWPTGGESLAEIFGSDNELAKTSMLHKVVEWVRADIRDADRLFLLGVLLYFDDDAEHAAELFAAAVRMAGPGEHLTAFLGAGSAATVQPPSSKPVVRPKVVGPDADLPPLPAPPKEQEKDSFVPQRPDEPIEPLLPDLPNGAVGGPALSLPSS